MNQTKRDWMEPNEINYVSEGGPFDLAQVLLYQQGKFRFAINEFVRTLIIEYDVDGNQNANGVVNLYHSDGTTGNYWRRVKAGTGRVILLPSTKFIVGEPAAGSTGIIHVQMVRQALTPGSYNL
jgi:hypothetical protein